jgi:hypothetical protein
MDRTYDLTEKQLKEIVMEAVKIVTKEGKDYLYGVNPEGDQTIGQKQNIEGCDIKINSAGTLHIVKCTKCGNMYTAVDTNGHRLDIPVENIEEFLNGESIEATLENDEEGEDYIVFITLEHPSEFQTIEKYRKDINSERPIFGNTKMGDI